MEEKIRVKVEEPQPWTDRTQPVPPALLLDRFELDRPLSDVRKRRRVVYAEIRRLVKRKVRSISVAVEGQDFDVVVYTMPDGSGPVRKRPVKREGPQGGPLGRDIRSLRRGGRNP